MIPTADLNAVLLAHAGEFHWYDYLLYLFPLIVVAGIFVVERWRDRSRRRPTRGSRNPANRPKR